MNCVISERNTNGVFIRDPLDRDQQCSCVGSLRGDCDHMYTIQQDELDTQFQGHPPCSYVLACNLTAAVVYRFHVRMRHCTVCVCMPNLEACQCACAVVLPAWSF